MKIAVLVSVGRHPVSGTARYSRNDAAALTMALVDREGARRDARRAACGRSVRSRVAGISRARRARGRSARRGRRRHRRARRAPARLRPRADRHACRRRVRQRHAAVSPRRRAGHGAGRLGGRLSRAATAGVEVRQFMPKGLRRRVRGVAARARRRASDGERRAALRLRASARRHDRAGRHARRLPTPKTCSGRSGPRRAKPVRLAAAEKRSGHARMLSATTTESRGGSVVIEGSSVEKAQVILAYLREHQLVDY